MGTTVRLDEKLLKEAKRQAAEAGMTLTAIVEESLRERLARKQGRAKPRNAVRLHTTGKGGVRASVDLDDSASLMDVMENID